MNTIPTCTIGKTGAQVSQVGFGSAPLGDLFEAVSEEKAQQTLQAAWDAGIRYFNTAPFYGYTKSEPQRLRLSPTKDASSISAVPIPWTVA
jgi:D-threo-aldose 1-dehydrogenase